MIVKGTTLNVNGASVVLVAKVMLWLNRYSNNGTMARDLMISAGEQQIDVSLVAGDPTQGTRHVYGTCYINKEECHDDPQEMAESVIFELHNGLNVKFDPDGDPGPKLGKIGLLQFGLDIAKREGLTVIRTAAVLQDVYIHMGISMTEFGDGQVDAANYAGDRNRAMCNSKHREGAALNIPAGLESKYFYAYNKLKDWEEQYAGANKIINVRSRCTHIAEVTPNGGAPWGFFSMRSLFSTLNASNHVIVLTVAQFFVYYITALEALVGGGTADIKFKNPTAYGTSWIQFRDRLVRLGMSQNLTNNAGAAVVAKINEEIAKG
jgi:hypothetical protein